MAAGLDRPGGKGHHLANNGLAIELTVLSHFAFAHAQRILPDTVAACSASIFEGGQRLRDLMMCLERLGEHQRILNGHSCALTKMGRGGVYGIANQNDALLMPGSINIEFFQRLINNKVSIGNLLAQFAR